MRPPNSQGKTNRWEEVCDLLALNIDLGETDVVLRGAIVVSPEPHEPPTGGVSKARCARPDSQPDRDFRHRRVAATHRPLLAQGTWRELARNTQSSTQSSGAYRCIDSWSSCATGATDCSQITHTEPVGERCLVVEDPPDAPVRSAPMRTHNPSTCSRPTAPHANRTTRDRPGRLRRLSWSRHLHSAPVRYRTTRAPRPRTHFVLPTVNDPHRPQPAKHLSAPSHTARPPFSTALAARSRRRGVHRAIHPTQR